MTMSTSKKTLLIAGAGQLGSRYLQSLVSFHSPIDIHLYDIDSRSFSLCAERWEEVSGFNTAHTISNHCRVDSLPIHFDLVVVTSTAGTRPKLVKLISQHSKVDYWILEKVLAQNREGLFDLLRLTAEAKGVWVNYYMSTENLYKAVKAELLMQNC